MMPDRREFVKLLCATGIGGALVRPLRLLSAERVPAPKRIEPGPIVVPRAGLSGFVTEWSVDVDPSKPLELRFTMQPDGPVPFNVESLGLMDGKRIYIVCEGD